MSQAFEWECQPEAERCILQALERYTKDSPFLQNLSIQLQNLTSSRLFDWLDHIYLDIDASELIGYGFEPEAEGVFYHPGAQLPRIVQGGKGVAVKVEWIADFLAVHGLDVPIEGSPLSSYRRCLVADENEVRCWVVERRGDRTMKPTELGDEQVVACLRARELWAARRRDGTDDVALMKEAAAKAEALVATVGRDMAAWIVLEGERAYWQARNRAGQLQKARQDRLGMGWANHDHHTFRSSRHLFPALTHFFETLGFHRRERFYAGDQAGWGAQVMENSNAGLVLFLDLDLSPEEAEVDFVDHALPDLQTPGTVGLWCALHGDSLLKAGMHHLEAQFLFDQLTVDLNTQGIGMMAPFSNFPYLKQAFTEGEHWQVDPTRLEHLVAQGAITPEQAQQFREHGALGSHLENLQRREGYKGFNKKNVSVIIEKTDPRNG